MPQIEIEVPAADGSAEAYLVTPEGPGPFPAVLMFMDAFGLRPRIMEMATRIAGRGYAVLAPNLLYRDARGALAEPDELMDGGKRAAAFGRLMPMIRNLTAERISADTAAYLDFLTARPEVAEGPAGLVGYCMGGRNGLIAAAELPDRIGALASFHAGSVVTDRPDSPHRKAGALRCEVYFGHADNDGSMTPDQIKALESAFEEAGTVYTSELYEGAPHGFTMSDTSLHHEAAEQRHWERLFALLDRALPVR